MHAQIPQVNSKPTDEKNKTQLTIIAGFFNIKERESVFGVNCSSFGCMVLTLFQSGKEQSAIKEINTITKKTTL